MKTAYDVVIIGGGIMGLLSAYEIAKSERTVLVIEKSRIGGASAASAGLTRSLRNDYQNPQYSRLAREAWNRWSELEAELGQTLVVRCSCLNLAEEGVQYARQAAKWLKRDDNPIVEFTSNRDLQAAYPQFAGLNYGVVDTEAGLGLANKALQLLRDNLQRSTYVEVAENCSVSAIKPDVIETNLGAVRYGKVVIAAGLGSSELLEAVEDSMYSLSLSADRPTQCVYYEPTDLDLYDSARLPAFAYLDRGVYGHPVVRGVTKAVKIGLYSPPSIVTNGVDALTNIDGFVSRFMPALKQTARSVEPVTDTDGCAYDMTDDDNFVVGLVPDAPHVIVATGFCGTGYKFAPAIAQIVSDLTANRLARYDITAFNPARFCASSN